MSVQHTPEQVLSVAKVIYPDAVHDKLWNDVCFPDPKNSAQGNKFNPHSLDTCVKLLEWIADNHSYKLRYPDAILDTRGKSTIPESVFACALKIVEEHGK